MQTSLSGPAGEVVIGGGPTVLIGERINPTGRKRLAASLLAGDLSVVQREARLQVKAGADILDVNVGASGVDEVSLLPRAVQAAVEVAGVPLSLDSDNPRAIEAGLKAYSGKALVNSVTGRESSLGEILPLVKGYGAAVIGLTIDDDGIPPEADRRVSIAHKIVERAASFGIPPEDVVIDCLALTVATESRSAAVALEAIRRVRDEIGVNQTLGVSNVSYGLPDRDTLNASMLTMAIAAGVTCPTVNVARVRPAVLAADLLLGRDRYAMAYIKAFRQRQQTGT